MRNLGWYAYALAVLVLVVGVVPVLLAIGVANLPEWGALDSSATKTIGITFFAVGIAFVVGQWYVQARK